MAPYLRPSPPPPIDISDDDDDDTLSLCGYVMTSPEGEHPPGTPAEHDAFEFVTHHNIFTSPPTPTFGNTSARLPPLSAKRIHAEEHRRLPSGQEVSKQQPDGPDRSRTNGGIVTRKGRGSSSPAEYKEQKPMPEPRSDRGVRRWKSGEVAAPVRPKWYRFTLGSMKLPAEMEMKGMRSRQRRRNQSKVGADSVHCDGKMASGGRSWRLLKSLSCKANVDIIAGLRQVSGVT